MINITFNLRTNEIEIRFFKDAQLLILVKRIPGREFHIDRYWRVPLVQGVDIKPYIDRFIEEAKSAGHESEVDDLVWAAIETAANYREHNYALSLAEDYTEDWKLNSVFGRELNGIQRARVRYLFNNFAGVLYGSPDIIIPLIAIEYDVSFPSLVICPNERKFEIASYFKRMTRRSVFVVEEEQVMIHDARQAAGAESHASMCVCNFGNLRKYRTWLSGIEFQSLLIVGGEGIRSGTSEQVVILMDLARVIPHKIMMTTCDFINKPWELCAQLEVIGRLQDFGGRDKFMQDYTRTVKVDGYPVLAPSNPERLEKELRSICYTR